jgi:hypothetical protein
MDFSSAQSRKDIYEAAHKILDEKLVSYILQKPSWSSKCQELAFRD